MTAFEKSAQAIKSARGSASQQSFASHVIGCSLAALARWEAGKGSPTRYDHIEKLVDAGVDRSVLTDALAEQARGGEAA